MALKNATQVQKYVGRTATFMYHTVQREVKVEKWELQDGFIYITGKDQSRGGAYRTFKFVPEEMVGVKIH